MPKEYRFLPLIISLIAGIVVNVKFIIQKYFSLTGIVIILAVMLGFYIVGLIIRTILYSLRTPEPEETETDKEEEEIPDVSTAADEEEGEQE